MLLERHLVEEKDNKVKVKLPIKVSVSLQTTSTTKRHLVPTRLPIPGTWPGPDTAVPM